MARLNIEDHFWTEITQVAIKLGNEDLAIGQAVRLFRLAQNRAKQAKNISDDDWSIHGFSDALIPRFAKKIKGGYEVVGAEKHFGWLRDRVEAGRNGGKKSAAARPNENNNLRQAKSSKTEILNPLPLPLSLEGSKEPSLYTPQTELHWLGKLWNENCGKKLPKIKNTTAREKRLNKLCDLSPDKSYWLETIKKIAASDFLTGSTGWAASFDWLIGVDKGKTPNHLKVNEGNYDNRESGSKPASGDKSKWLGEVDVLIGAIKRIGADAGQGAMESFLGPERFKVYLEIGRSRVAQMRPGDDFARHELAKLIKNISERRT